MFRSLKIKKQKVRPGFFLSHAAYFYPQSFVMRRTLSIALAVFLTVFVAYYLSVGERAWVTITAFFVMQTTIGVTLRQGLQRYLLIASLLLLGSLIVLFVRNMTWVTLLKTN